MSTKLKPFRLKILGKYTDKKEWMEQVQKEVPIAELADYLNEQIKG